MAHITDESLKIAEILNVTKGHSKFGKVRCSSRKSDCFVYILSGHAVYTFDDGTAEAVPGNIMYLARNSKYYIDVDTTDYTHIYVDFNFHDSNVRDFSNFIYKHDSLKNLGSEFIKLRSEWLMGDLAQKINCMSLLYGIYSKIIASTISDYVSENQRNNVKKAINFIEGKYSDPELDVSSISSHIGLSDVHFRRIFFQVHGITPINFITNLRISKAKEMLKSEESSIEQIALQCGFSSLYYFSRVFKKYTGISPSIYRKEYT